MFNSNADFSDARTFLTAHILASCAHFDHHVRTVLIFHTGNRKDLIGNRLKDSLKTPITCEIPNLPLAPTGWVVVRARGRHRLTSPVLGKQEYALHRPFGCFPKRYSLYSFVLFLARCARGRFAILDIHTQRTHTQRPHTT